MSGKTKTIKINPDLFSLKKDRSKSKKNNANMLKPSIVINQNQVKKRCPHPTTYASKDLSGGLFCPCKKFTNRVTRTL